MNHQHPEKFQALLWPFPKGREIAEVDTEGRAGREMFCFPPHNAIRLGCFSDFLREYCLP